jgi:hypothetical protein
MVRSRHIAGIVGTLALLLAAAVAIPAWGADPSVVSGSVSPASSPVGSGQPGPAAAASPCDPSAQDYHECWTGEQAHAVALVLASDPRFAGLPDFARTR